MKVKIINTDINGDQLPRADWSYEGNPQTGQLSDGNVYTYHPCGIGGPELVGHQLNHERQAESDENWVKTNSPDAKNEQFIKQATDALYEIVNDLAKSWGYDSIDSIAKYAARGNSPWNAECILLGDYLDAVWAYGLQVMADWQAGGPKPTMESLIAGMPAAPVKP